MYLPDFKIITDGRFGKGTNDLYVNSNWCNSNKIYSKILSYCYVSYGSSYSCARDCYTFPKGLKCYCKYIFTSTKIKLCKILASGDCNEGEVRLVNGTLEREGRLEVCSGGVWGTVCASGFTKLSAYVACKQLGYAAHAAGTYILSCKCTL